MNAPLKWSLVLVVALAAGVTFASLATAGGGRSAPAHAAKTRHHMQLRAAATSDDASSVTRREVGPFTVPPGATDGDFIKCSTKTPHAISGYFGTDAPGRDSDLVLVRSTPIGTSGRKWEVAVRNVSSQPVPGVFIGGVCLK